MKTPVITWKFGKTGSALPEGFIVSRYGIIHLTFYDFPPKRDFGAITLLSGVCAV